MKKFIIKTSLFSFLILTLLMAVNYWGDAAKIFHSGFEKKIAKILYENLNATNLSNYDERLLQREIINKIDDSLDIVILGSSRTMLIHDSYFKNKKIMNNSVSGASLEDIIAIYQLYKAENILPKRIIIGVDPWLFNKNNNQKRWLPLKKEYDAFLNNSVEKENPIISEKFKQLLSFSYFQASLKNIPKVIKGGTDPVATKKKRNKSLTKLTDGSIIYPKKLRKRTSSEVESRAQSYVSGRVYSIENFNKISPKFWSEFDLLCKDIINNKIELDFILTPYHPIAYTRIERDYPNVKEVQSKIEKYAKENQITVYGSYNPNVLNLSNSGFYDGMHSKETTIKKILKAN